MKHLHSLPLDAANAKPAAVALECRMATPASVFDAAVTPPAEIMWMPAGTHSVWLNKGDEPLNVIVQVDRNTAAKAQQMLEAHRSVSAHRPWFDFDHDKDAASGWPTEFLWRDTPAPGVYVKVEWSKPGAEAISGKAYRAFSPTFYVDDETAKPASVIGTPLNMGGLVNDPAFTEIQPLWAKRALGNHTVMTLEELAALQAAMKQLKEENAELKAKAASSETVVAIAAKDKQIEALNGKIINLDTELKAKRKLDAKAAVDAAVARGALPPKDEALQAKWCGLIEGDASHAELLAKMAGTPATQQQTLTRAGDTRGGDVTIIREDIAHVVTGYLNAKSARDKGLVYRADINGRLDKGEIIPFGAIRDRLPLDAANSLGTLVGNIITQRTLALIYSKRPMLRAITTDFSDQGAFLNQSILTRTMGLPTVQAFPGGAATDRADTDYTVTLNLAKQVLYSLTTAEYMSTGRDLVREQSEALAVTLGNYMVDTVAALITAAFTGVTTLVSASVDYSTMIGITKALNVAGVPDMERHAWVNSDVAQSLRNDEIVMENFDRSNTSGYAHWKNLEGFDDVFEYPALPANATNLTGFFGHVSSLILASRTIVDPAAIIGAGYPGKLQTVTDPVSGLSVTSNQWVAADTLAVNDRLIALFGCARGNVTAAQRLVSA